MSDTQIEKGIESLKAAVQQDAREGNNCFNENGCDHEFHRSVPADARLKAMGIRTMTISVCKCTHKYCDKYKWVLDRAKHYAEKNGMSPEEIITIWENDRSYWYMNYYQECNMPLNGRPKADVEKYKQEAHNLQAELKTWEYLVTTLSEEHHTPVKVEIESKVQSLKEKLRKKRYQVLLLEITGFGDTRQ